MGPHRQASLASILLYKSNKSNNKTQVLVKLVAPSGKHKARVSGKIRIETRTRVRLDLTETRVKVKVTLTGISGVRITSRIPKARTEVKDSHKETKAIDRTLEIDLILGLE